MKASFFRNVPNYEKLCYNSFNYKGIIAEYSSIATICLEEKEFVEFSDNFQKGHKCLIYYIDKAIITHKTWKCVSIVCGDIVILVVMDHYQYPRYSALLSE